MYPNAVAMIIYTDGGPDHNNKHTSVRLGLLALFLDLDLDTMVVMRTAPTQSWANPVERVMSVLNLGLQGVALARCEMEKDYEDIFKKCNGMKAVRNAADEYEKALGEQPPSLIASAEEVDMVAASAAQVVDVVDVSVEDTHRDEARDEDAGQPHRHTMTAEEVDPAAASTIEVAHVVVVAMEDIQHDEARDENDGQPHCPSVNVEEVDTVAANAVEVNDVVVVMEDTHRDEERYDDGGQSHRPTISEERVATVAAIAIEVADAVIVDEDTHYDKANDNEGDCFWNYDNDDDVLDVDDVNIRYDDDDDDREAVSEQPSVQQPTSNVVPIEGGNPFIKAYLASIQQARDLINGQWSGCTWDSTNLSIEEPATTDEV
jgi:hypothetical protein